MSWVSLICQRCQTLREHAGVVGDDRIAHAIDPVRKRQRRFGKRCLVKGQRLLTKKYSHQGSQPTAQAVTGEGDARRGVGRFYVQVVGGRLQQLLGPAPAAQIDIGLAIGRGEDAEIVRVGAGVGDDDFGARLYGCELFNEGDRFKATGVVLSMLN